MDRKKNLPDDYTLATQNDSIITIKLWKAAALVATTILTAMVGSAFTALRILNSDHFALSALGTRVDAIEETHITLDTFTQVEKRLDRIEAKLDRLIEK